MTAELFADDEISCVWASYDGSQPCGLPLADNTDEELPYCDEHLPLIVRAQWAETDYEADRDYWAAGSF